MCVDTLPKSMFKITTFSILFAWLSLISVAQEFQTARTYPTSDFRSPLDLTIDLSGTFGEIRSNHFHSGMDIRTNQTEGHPVYAVADGHVSRLRVQIGGFGNAVYIDHPNGYTSVYAHLQRFNPRLALTVKSNQYSREQYDVDFPLLPIDIPVKKGELIAWSGNTGSSGGPHLHFEVRDTKTEEIINPQLLGIAVADNAKPTIRSMYIYRLNELAFSEKTPKQYFQVVGSAGNYSLSQSPIINLNGKVGFGIATSDQSVASGNQHGVYSIELKLDEKTIYSSALERFYFNHSRAANAHIDYPNYLNQRVTIQKSFVEPGNPIRIYQNLVNNGLVELIDDQVHNMEYRVKDFKGNTSTLFFKVRNGPKSIASQEPTGVQKFNYNKVNEFSRDDIKISIPIGVLYSDLNFTYSQTKKNGTYSSLHQVHTRAIPLHEAYSLWIKPDTTLSTKLHDKALIADVRGVAYLSSYDNGYVKANPTSFGNFYVTIDTIAPIIRPINITDGKSMKGLSRISFKISDNLSGIKSFRGTIDGTWVLMEYDQKTATLWHTFDQQTPSGKHLLKLELIDNKLNTKTYTATFYR